MPASVDRGRAFLATVQVRSAAPGQSVTVTLEQTRGTKPLWRGERTVGLVSERGMAAVSFKVVLAGPCYAVLLATARDHLGVPLSPDGESVEVL